MQHPQEKAIVIGAGIAGCSTAYALAKRGIAVTLVERQHSIALEGSGNPVGMLYPKFDSSNSIGSDIAREGFAFTLSLLKSLTAQVPFQAPFYDLCGQIQLAFNKREQDKQAKLMNTKLPEHRFQVLSAKEASEKAQIPLTIGGLYLPESGWVKPQVFCENLINTSLIKKITSTKAISIIKHHKQWQVSLSKGQTLEAPTVVICNATALHQFEPFKNIPITPVRGQVNFFQSNTHSNHIKPIICSDHYLSPAVDGMHSIGTSYAPHDVNPSLSLQDTQANMQALKAISPWLFNHMNQTNITGRVAWRSATKDYFPVAGQLIDEPALRKMTPRYNDSPDALPWLKGLYVNAGHGSKGMITAPMCGELIANLINNETPFISSEIASKLNPSRFLLRDLGLKQLAQNLYHF